MGRFLRLPETTPVTAGDLTDVGISVEAADFVWAAPKSADAAADGDGVRSRGEAAARREEGREAAADEGDEGFALRSIEMRGRAGQLLALVGPVGAGKTALLAALLGDMPLSRGKLALRGTVAYAAQDPFILSASIRDNICFGRPYHAEWYSTVVTACQLDRDIGAMAAADLTVVGERGVALSGGQRARVALARAVYADAQVLRRSGRFSHRTAEVGLWMRTPALGRTGVPAR